MTYQVTTVESRPSDTVDFYDVYLAKKSDFSAYAQIQLALMLNSARWVHRETRVSDGGLTWEKTIVWKSQDDMIAFQTQIKSVLDSRNSDWVGYCKANGIQTSQNALLMPD